MTDRAGGADARRVPPPAPAKPLGPRRFLRVRKAERRPTDSQDPRGESPVNGADFPGSLHPGGHLWQPPLRPTMTAIPPR